MQNIIETYNPVKAYTYIDAAKPSGRKRNFTIPASHINGTLLIQYAKRTIGSAHIKQWVNKPSAKLW